MYECRCLRSRSPEAGATGRCESPDKVLGTNIQFTTKVASDTSYSAISPVSKKYIESFKTKVFVSFPLKSQAVTFLVCHCYCTGASSDKTAIPMCWKRMWK